MQIDKKKRAGFVAALAEALQVVETEHGLYVDHSSLAAIDALESRLDARMLKHLQGFIGERPLAFFVNGLINARLGARPFEKDSHERLIDVPGIPALDQLAEEIAQGLEELPEDYFFSVQLADKIDAGLVDGRWPVGFNAVIAKGEAFSRDFPIQVPTMASPDPFELSFANLLKRPLPAVDKAHITVRASGYLQRFVNHGPTHEIADHAIRSFFGLAMVFGGLRYRPIFDAETAPLVVYVHTWPGLTGSAVPHLKFSLSPSTSRALRGLEFSKLEGLPDKTSWPERMGAVDAYMEAVLDSPRGEVLSRAARWFFDSFGADSLLMQYLHAMVAMEILLGEADPEAYGDISIGALLRNRCAYLIGKDAEERDEIAKALKKIYTVRSQIIHRGKASLSSEERKLLATLRWYCARVIWTEAEKLGAPHHQAPPTLEDSEGADAGED